LIKSTRTIPFFTTIPTNKTAPNAATMDRVVLVINNAKTIPGIANAKDDMMINGILNDSNCVAITM
jgi:hypothetical protein